jgi:hypothetical protein
MKNCWQEKLLQSKFNNTEYEVLLNRIFYFQRQEVYGCIVLTVATESDFDAY